MGGSSGRRYITEQWHNVPLLRTRGLIVIETMYDNSQEIIEEVQAAESLVVVQYNIFKC